jgi:hypothetical protein
MSERALILEVRTTKPKQPSMAELNARVNADSARIMRAAEENTRRLTGKPAL